MQKHARIRQERRRRHRFSFRSFHASASVVRRSSNVSLSFSFARDLCRDDDNKVVCSFVRDDDDDEAIALDIGRDIFSSMAEETRESLTTRRVLLNWYVVCVHAAFFFSFLSFFVIFIILCGTFSFCHLPNANFCTFFCTFFRSLQKKSLRVTNERTKQNKERKKEKRERERTIKRMIVSGRAIAPEPIRDILASLEMTNETKKRLDGLQGWAKDLKVRRRRRFFCQPSLFKKSRVSKRRGTMDDFEPPREEKRKRASSSTHPSSASSAKKMTISSRKINTH